MAESVFGYDFFTSQNTFSFDVAAGTADNIKFIFDVRTAIGAVGGFDKITDLFVLTLTKHFH